MTRRFFPMRPIWPLVCSIVWLLAGLASIAHGAELTFVAPNVYANSEAAWYAGSAERIRAQYIYAASQFGDLPGGGGYLTSYRWRPDGATTLPFSWSLDELSISASVTTRAPGAMSWTFANNITGSVTVVRAAAAWQGESQNVGPPGGPKAFDVEFMLDTPLLYNPAEGNLLLDMVGEGEVPPAYMDRLADGDRSIAAVMVAGWAGSLPVVAQAYVGGMPVEMTFVPLPGDYNHDTVVDDLDYATWKAAFGSTVAAYAGADGNGDGFVDAADYTVWRDHRGSSVANGGVAIAIPEPASIGLLVVATALLGARHFTTNRYECVC